MIDVFREIGRSHGAFVERRTHLGGIRMELLREAGQGWFDACRLGNNGMTLGRSCYRSAGETVMSCRDDADCLGFSLLLSGQMVVSLSDIAFRSRVVPGEIWLRRGQCGQYQSVSVGRQVHRGVSIDLPRPLLSEWLDQSPSVSDRMQDMLLNPEPGWLRLPAVDVTPSHAERLLLLDCDSIIGRLQAESLALDWLAHLLGAVATPGQSSAPRSRLSERIDEAVAILQAECMNPPGILDLARRIGINECYLKRGLKERTGLGVAAYTRALRMQKAGELLRGGMSVQQVSAQLGYLNPSQFAKAFRQHFGVLPSVFGSARRAGG